MKALITACLLLVSSNVIAQINESIMQQGEKIVYLKNLNGDSVRIVARPVDFTNDTAIVRVEIIKKNKITVSQEFKTLYSSPLDISPTSFNNKNGIYIKYDPAVKNGNVFLYLFNEGTNKLNKVTGFRDLGTISTIIKNNQKYYYSYASCGCADNCWKSIMFKIKNYKIDTVAYLSCDCEKLIEKLPKTKKKILNSCKDFNNTQKFDKINAYWNEKIKNIL